YHAAGDDGACGEHDPILRCPIDEAVKVDWVDHHHTERVRLEPFEPLVREAPGVWHTAGEVRDLPGRSKACGCYSTIVGKECAGEARVRPVGAERQARLTGDRRDGERD